METDYQREIERAVTSNRGYNGRKNTDRIPLELKDTEIGLQIALANMDITDGRGEYFSSIDNIVGFSSQLKAMLRKFDNERSSYSTITTAEEFRDAFNSAYTLPNRKDKDTKLADSLIEDNFQALAQLKNYCKPRETKPLSSLLDPEPVDKHTLLDESYRQTPRDLITPNKLSDSKNVATMRRLFPGEEFSPLEDFLH